MSPDERDSELLARVHPPGWTNPTPSGRYNLVVIGAGTAGLVTAAGAAGLGAKVALIERARMGGDCLNYGCVPSKALIRTATLAQQIRRSAAYGIAQASLAIDFAAVIERVANVVRQVEPHDSVERYTGLGVGAIHHTRVKASLTRVRRTATHSIGVGSRAGL